MGSTAVSVFGIGFRVDSEKVDFVKFLEAHEKSFCASFEESERYRLAINSDRELATLEEIFSGYICDANGGQGLCAAISNIIARETNIRFAVYDYAMLMSGSKATLPALIFEEGFPWHLNDVERSLTLQGLYDVCTRYSLELGITESPQSLCVQ